MTRIREPHSSLILLDKHTASIIMYTQEQIKPYGDNGSKREQVERMFNNIAHSYDMLNHTLTGAGAMKPYAFCSKTGQAQKMSSTLPQAQATLPSSLTVSCIPSASLAAT